jgi:hypothetical protein
MAQKLKADFHIHTAEDPKDYIKYTARELIEKASTQGFDVLSITNHNAVTHDQDLVKYAEGRGILLIPGIELTLSCKHILIINPDFKEYPRDRALEDLAKIKNDQNLIIAPHPFFRGGKSLRSDLYSCLPYLDAIEFAHCYNHWVNMNKKAVLASQEYHKPLIATSDSHNIWQLGKAYTLIDAKKETLSVIDAIKAGRIEIVAKPLSLFTMSRVAVNFILSDRLHLHFRI